MVEARPQELPARSGADRRLAGRRRSALVGTHADTQACDRVRRQGRAYEHLIAKRAP